MQEQHQEKKKKKKGGTRNEFAHVNRVGYEKTKKKIQRTRRESSSRGGQKERDTEIPGEWERSGEKN